MLGFLSPAVEELKQGESVPVLLAGRVQLVDVLRLNSAALNLCSIEPCC
jgi:hypothetical protein